MVCHGQLMLSFAVLMGVITSGVCIVVDRPKALVHQKTQVAVRPTEISITSKRAREVVITITNADGKLREGDNAFCVLLQNKETRKPLDVQNVSVDFTLLVGRIPEEPIRAHLAQDQPSRYCGHVNLGKQHYVPASYCAFVLYTDAGGKKKEGTPFLECEVVGTKRALRVSNTYEQWDVRNAEVNERCMQFSERGNCRRRANQRITPSQIQVVRRSSCDMTIAAKSTLGAERERNYRCPGIL